LKPTFKITEFDKESLDKFDHWFDNIAFYQGDFEGMASVYTEDAKLMNEDSEIIQGREAIEAFWKAATERAKAVEMKRTKRTEEFGSSCDFAYKRTRLTLEIPVKDRVVTHSIKSITVWKRGADGVWRIAIDISNRNAPLDTSHFTYGVATETQTKPKIS